MSGSMTTSPAPRPGRRPGRPAKRLDPAASLLAHLGAELRRTRLQRELTLIRLGELTGYSWQHLGNIERGQVVPAENVIIACERALSAGGRLISLLPGVIREQAAQRHAREAARHHSAPAPSDDIDWSRLAAATARPSAMTLDLVEELEAITDRQRRLYHELTSAQMSVPVEAHLGLLTSLLGNAPSTPLRHRIASAASEAAGFAAWIWHDLGDPHKSALYYRTARDLLPEAGNPALASYISGYQALASDADGTTADAVQHAQKALATAPKATTRLTRSWLSALAASALAATSRRPDSLALLHQAQEHFDAAQDREEWMYEFDRTALADYRGQCHLRLGQPKDAINAFSEGLAALPTTCERRGAQITIGLAEAHLSDGRLDQATDAAHRSLEVFAARGSVSGLLRVRRFRDLLRDGGHQREADQMDQHVRAQLQEPQ
ncbi:helix-turn-helix domain-containing protein [Actinomadura nitritigenes]|uniref:Helix-turn-helix transcriptional regulator n=1 Tax=Actinomadura nitritigenes TaxID=134602 RepID=A0ABS3R202_9ACTN|nr:helix-turn-helix transcriptional regulator [Actinomadura nitritigenes]MBO2440263.1 helix-turn-helix transcriptional regulator [Actinomadura nitritigenes]